MRVVHHSTLVEAGSGMMMQVIDQVRAERRAGLDSGVVCTDPKNEAGGAKVADVTFQGWKWMLENPEETVHVIHSHPPRLLSTLKHRVVFLHGTPEHCAIRQMWPQNQGIPFTTSVNLIQLCEAAVTLIPRHKQFWELFDAGAGKVHAVHGGVDIADRFRPVWAFPEEEQKATFEAAPGDVQPKLFFAFSARPAVLVAESYYEIKMPLAAALSVRYVVKKHPLARLEFFNVKNHGGITDFWTRVAMPKSLLDAYVDAFAGRVPNIERYYRGAHVYLAMTLGGDMSRGGAEAMACGTPTISLSSGKWSYDGGNWTAENNPEDIAEKIAQIWEDIQDDEMAVRKRARAIAEEHFDIDRTVRELKPVYERALGEG